MPMVEYTFDVGRCNCPMQERILVWKTNLPSYVTNTYTVLVSIFSLASSTFFRTVDDEIAIIIK